MTSSSYWANRRNRETAQRALEARVADATRAAADARRAAGKPSLRGVEARIDADGRRWYVARVCVGRGSSVDFRAADGTRLFATADAARAAVARA